MKTTLQQLKEVAAGLRVLYAEDDSSLNASVTTYLKKFFSHVASAVDGKEGAELFEKSDEGFDIVITDIKMPKMDGLEMLEKIKKHNPSQMTMII